MFIMFVLNFLALSFSALELRVHMLCPMVLVLVHMKSKIYNPNPYSRDWNMDYPSDLVECPHMLPFGGRNLDPHNLLLEILILLVRDRLHRFTGV